MEPIDQRNGNMLGKADLTAIAVVAVGIIIVTTILLLLLF